MFAKAPSHSTALGPGCAGPPLANPQQLSSAQASAHERGSHQPSCGAAPFAVDASMLRSTGSQPHKHTQSPYVTGSSVLAITYAGGVMLASDTLASYGSTKRYKSVQRLVKVNDSTVLGAGGEISDLQFILNMLDDLKTEDYCADDGQSLSSQELYSYLSRVMYNRRNKMDPLWNSLIIAGLEGGKPFLGSVNMIGVAFSDDHLATGFGNHLARPLFRKRHRPDMSEEEATALIREALEVCYYRDKQSINKFQIAKVTASEGVSISEPFALPTKWEYKAFVDPTRNAVGVW
ncbi:hypothetical protein WJX74_003127 [Apatococcus lobatus]|uniref:Proteasome subunit beta n=1 Tax=Apatococcus lobatus TaxID=904363 RepID=A0AAW1R1M6_9CHLO